MTRLSLAVDPERDHIRGPADAPVTLIEYSNYECRYCRLAHPGIERIAERLGGRLRYVFRHLPNTNQHPASERLAEAAEAAGAQGRFWEMHRALFRQDEPLSDGELEALAGELGLDAKCFASDLAGRRHADHIAEDADSAISSGARGTPSFYINGERYDGPWDQDSVLEAVERPLGYRVRQLSQEFAGLAASGGLILLTSAILALVWANSPWAASYHDLWTTELAVTLAGETLSLPLHAWVNDALMALFFFVVGLEIKREMIAGELATFRQAALPVAGALGGMLAPAVLYALFNAWSSASAGWGVPMATDIAFTLGLMAMLGKRVPLSLKVFVAALAIADDLGAIVVIAVFYTTDLSLWALAVAGGCVLAAVGLNRARVYRPWPYAVVGVVLWLAVLYSGVHATLAGVALAMTIPTLSPPSTSGLLAQSLAAFGHLQAPSAEKRQEENHYQSAVRTLETVVARLLSPAQRLERDLQPWSSYLVLPLFALANAGITVDASAVDPLAPVSLGIFLGLVVGKPLGILCGTALAVKTGLAAFPEGVSWRHLIGTGCLCGIGFTMSIFIADAAFMDSALLSQAKLTVMAASVVAGAIGCWVLWGAAAPGTEQSPHPSAAARDPAPPSPP